MVWDMVGMEGVFIVGDMAGKSVFVCCVWCGVYFVCVVWKLQWGKGGDC